MSDFNVCVKNITSDFPIILNATLKNVPKISTKLARKNSQNIVSRYLLILCGVIVLTWYLQILWRMRRLYYYYYKSPGPISLPFIGIGYKFLTRDLGAFVWKKHRRAIKPAFNQKILDAYQDVFWKKAEILADLFKKEVGNKNLELFQSLSCCTLDIICETALGINMNTQTTNEMEFGKALDKLMEITSIRTLNPLHQLEFTWKINPTSREFDKNMKIFDDFVSTVISNKLRDYSNRSTRRNSCFEDAVAPVVKGR
uniref:Cytochrome P450 4C1-like isoform X2 n=1 Tax=Diabrotica virgifera virgifera TaxID=50390 RepID=A0A6P7GYC3_DIAVI